MTEEHRNYQLRLNNRRLEFRNLMINRACVILSIIAVIEFIALIYIYTLWKK